MPPDPKRVQLDRELLALAQQHLLEEEKKKPKPPKPIVGRGKVTLAEAVLGAVGHVAAPKEDEVERFVEDFVVFGEPPAPEPEAPKLTKKPKPPSFIGRGSVVTGEAVAAGSGSVSVPVFSGAGSIQAAPAVARGRCFRSKPGQLSLSQQRKLEDHLVEQFGEKWIGVARRLDVGFLAK